MKIKKIYTIQQRLDNKSYRISDKTWRYKLPKIISKNPKKKKTV